MNKVFKVIYNHSLRVWVAVSELAKGYVKSSSSSTKKQKNKKKGLLNLTSGSLLTAATILGTSSIAYAWTPNTQGGNNDYIWSGAGIAIGEGPNNEGSTALNKNAEVRGRHGIAIGGDSRANSTNSVAIGYGSRAESVHYGSETQKLTIGNYTSNITYAGAPNASTPVFSIGNSTSPRQLQYVAAGRVSENSTDAVNGSQLFAAIEALKDQNGLSGVMFNLTTSKSGTGNVTNNTTHGVEKGQLVTIDAGDNINITQAGGKVTIATSATPNFTSVNTGGLTVRPNSVVNFGGNVLANVGTPTNNTDAANKKYVDDRTFGLTTQNGNVSSKLDKSIGVEGGNTNINTSVVDGKVKINLNNTLDLGTSGSVKVGDSTLNNAGLTIAGGPSVTKKDGINAGNKKITNVSNGTNATDAVNFSQLNATNQNVTNLTTEVAKGWNINTSNSSGGNVSGNSLTNIKMGDTVFIDAGQNINITQSGQKISIATSSTPIFETVTANSSFKVGRTNVTNGAVSGIDDNLPSILNYEYRLPGQEGFPKANVNVTNAANVNDVLNAGWNLRSNDKNVDFVKTYDTVDLSDGDGTKVNFERNSSANSSVIKVNVQYDNSTIVKNANGKLAVNTSNIIKGDNTTTQITNNTIAVKTGNVSVNPNGTAVANTTNGSIATVTDVASAINDSYHTVNTVKNNNQVIAGANATGTQVKAGSTITYGAGKNLEIAQNGNNITYGLSKDIDVTNVTATNVKTGNTTLNDAGLTIANGPSVTKDGINAGDKKITNVLDGTDPLDAVNLSQLNASKSVVEAGNNIKVTPNPTANGTVYTVEANTGSATFTNGNASTPDGSALATTGDLVNVTNNASQYLTDKGLNFAGNKGGNIHKNLGETLTIKGTLADGKDASSENLRVDSNGNELVVQMAKDLANLTSVTTTGDNGTTKVSGDGIVIDPKVAGKDNVSLTTNGLNNGNNKIVNVANGTDPLDAVNFSQLNATNQNVTNLNNEIAKGWNINTSSSTGGNVTGNTATNIKMGDTVVVDAGKNINITQTGQKISIATSSTPTFDSVDTGNLTVRANGSVNFNNVTLKNVGAPTQDGDAANKKYVDDRTFGLTTQNGNVSSKLDKSIGVEGGNTNINTSVADGKVKINLNNTLNLGTSGSVTVGDSTLNNAGLTIAGGPSVTKDGINAGDKKITNVLDGTDPLDAVNLSQLNASKSVVEAGNNIKVTPTPSANGTVYTVEANTGSATFTNGNASTPDGSALATTGDLVNVTNNASQYLTDKGLNFAGNKGGNIHKNLGETLTIKGTLADGKDASSENLRVDSNGNELVVQMAKDLANLTSVTTTGDNGTTKVDGDGITISPTAPGEGKGNVSLTGNGLDNGGNSITNVSSNLANTDNNTTAAPTTLADGTTPLANATLSNGATLGDVLNAGWNLQGNGDAKDFVKHGDTVNFNNGVGTKVNITKNGTVNNIQFDTTSSYVDADGKLTPNATNSVKFVGANESAPVSVTNVDSGVLPNGATLDKDQSFNDALNNVSGAQLNNAVNVGDLKNATKDITDNTLGKVGFNLTTTANGGESQVDANLSSEDKRIANNDTFSLNAGKNITVKQVKDGYEITTGNNLVIGEKGEPGQDGQDGKDGIDGSIGVKGKDGSSVVINGKDGSIGLTGPAGKDGKDGANANISVAEGKTTVNPKDGDNNITRIVYNTTNPDGTTTTREVATMDDGLKFKGDDNQEIAKQLGETLAITGGLTDANKLADNNIGVVKGEDGLVVKLAKDLANLTSVTTTGDNGTTKVDGDGITISPTAPGEGKGNVSLTGNGLDNGGNSITNVSSNLANTDNNTTAAPTTLADGTTPLANATLSNGATLGDVLNAGWNLQGNGDAKDFVKHGDTVNFNNGVGTKVNITKNGTVNNIQFDTTSSYVDADGKLTPNATNSVKFVGANESAPVSVTNVDSGVLPNGATLDKDQSFNDALNNVSGAQLNNAVNVGDLKNATKDITDNTLGKVGFNLTTTANGGESQVDANLSSEDKRIANNDTFSLNAGKNITVKQVKDGYEIATGNNLVIGEKGEPGQNGQNGKDGVDGSIGVNGKDGSSVVINGKDGSIGLTGPAGKDGKDGANANISVAEGKTTVNPKDGDNNITRIVYNTTNPDGTTTTREVATMDDGLKFKGDDNQEIAKQLGETLAITGGLTDANKLADNNIGVVKGEDGLVVKLAKDLANLTSVTTIGDNGTTKVSGDGIVIDPNAEGKGNVSLTGNGLDNGGNTITNVSSGLVDAEGNPTDLANATGTNAVNVGDLNATVNNLTNSTTGGFGLTDDNGDAVKADLGKTVSVIGDGSVTTNVVTNEDGTKALQVALSNNVTVGEKGADGKPGADGSIGVNGKDGSSVVINGKDGSIGLNGKDGKDGLTIKGEQGPAGVNGKNGENVTRIVYQPTDENGQPKGEPETVATLNDGLKFQGDSGDAIAKKLNETLTIKGGLTDANKLADNNIGVVNDNGSLVVKLAKDLANLTSVTTTGDNGTTKVDGDGITISPTAPGEGKGDVKLTGNGLDNGGNTITNVSSNLAGTDNNTTAAPTTLADGNTLDNATLSNGATLGDVLNAGWNLQGNGDAKDFVKHGDTVNFTDGVGTKVNITTNGSISNIKFDTTSSYVDADGKLTPNATNSVKFVGANESAPVSVTNVDSGVLPNGTTLADGQSFSDALETAVNNGNGTNVVNVNDLHQATKDITDNTLDKVGFNLTTVANGGESQVEENLTDEEKRIANNDTFTLNAGKNITVKQVKDGYEIATGNNLVIGEKGEPGQNGQNGKDGVDGSIGVNGKDGSSVVINGKDGSIGLNGKDGKDGLTIKGEQGPAGVNGKNGENVTRIVYQPTGENGQPKGDPETVATLNDGLKFQGDSGDAIAKKLNETLTIKGGLTDANKLADNNIGVVNDNGSLVVKLAKDLANLTSVTTTGDNGTTKVDGDGITISPTAPGEGKGDVKLTGNGLDNGGNTITNVSSNLAGTDNNTTAAPTTLADGNTLDNATLSNGASLGDVLNAGWNLQGNGDAKDFVKHGDTVNFTDGVGTKVNITTNGSVSNIKFDTTSSYVDADGKLTPNATNSVKFVGTNESAPVSVTNVDSGVLPNGTTLADGQSFNDVLNNVSGAQLNNAVNVGDLQNATKDITDNTLGKVGFNLTTVANGGESQVEENLTDEDKRIANNDTFSLNAGKNITVKQVKDGYEIATGNNLVIGEKGEAGQDGQNGKDGVDGSIGVNGKDGSSVVINGKDGSIGLTGPAGKDGVNGKDGLISANIKLGEGQTTVEPKDGGKEITRVVYETTRPVLDAEGNPQKDENGNIIMENVTREVATMDDGLKFQGDKGEVIAKKLGETLAIKGNLDSNATVTDKNLRVDNEDGALVVKMAKDLQELTSISLSGDNASTVLNGEGIVIDPKADGKGNVSLTDKGLNNGGNTITNVANGTNGTDAVNLDQLNATGAASKTYVEEGQNVNVTSKTNKDGSTTYTVSTSNNIVVGEKGEAGQDGQNGKDGIDGSIGVNGKDGSSVVINGKDGSIGLTGPAGKDGVNGKDGLISANIKLGEGQTTVEPKDGGKEITRVVYETTRPVLDAEGNPQKDENGNIIMENVTREVATMDDGLKFQGDKGEVIAKKLGETLAIKGNLDSNATVTDKNLRVDNDNGTLVVKMAKDLQELTSISLSGDNVSTVLNGGGITISPTNPAEGKGNVSLTDKGLNNGGNTITNVANGTNGTDAVNLDQLNATGAASKTYVEEGQNVNVTSKTNKDGSTTYTVSTSNNIVVGEKGEAGQDGQNGKDGIDGSIGVNGKDGSSVVINGKDGSIGLTGPAGKDGVNGKDGLISANIKLGEGQTTVEPKDGGKEITRVVYETTRPVLDAEGNPQKDENGNIIMENVTREVATMDDGLKFQGDKGEVIAKKLGETLAIKGNLASNATVTDKNLRVDNDNGTLVVKMAKDLQELTSISLSGDNVSTVLNGGGITISPTNPAEGKGNVSLTDKGLNNGGNTITNVANGTNGTDAVNLDQLNATGAASKTYVEEGQNVNVTSKTNKDGSTTYTVSTSNNIVVGEKGEAGQDGQNGKDGIDGSIGVNGKDGSSVVINGKDGSIGLNGKDGKDGLTIKGAQGPAGVDGKDGETTTRIVYQPKDAEGNPTGKPETVATLNDGLKFQGDKGGVIAKKLNETLTIKGNLDSNATVTDKNLRVDNDSDSLVIKMAKDLADLSSVTTSNPNGTTKVSGDGISITPTNPAEGKGNVSLTGNGLDNGGNTITNVSSGLVDANGKPTDLSNATSSNAVNVGDLKNTVTDLTTDGFGLTDDKGTAVKADLGKTVSVIGDGSVKTQVVDGENGTKALQVALSNNVTVGEKGKDGQDGVDGTIGVNGKDGSAVVINGKDGSIGLNGKDGKDGLTIKGAQGPAGVDGKDGETTTRIVYQPKDAEGNPTGEPETVATLNDGLKFQGDKGGVIAKKLNETLTIKGNLDSNATVTDKNLRVDNDNDSLVIKMAKDLADLSSVTTSNPNGTTKVSGDGISITPTNPAEGKGNVSLTGNGLDNGGNTITNVSSGLVDADGNPTDLSNATSSNAVNVGDLKNTVTDLTTDGFGLTDDKGTAVKADLGKTVSVIGDGSVTTKVVDGENGTKALQVALSNNVTVGEKGKDGKDGVDGTIGVNGQDGSAVVINGKDGSIGLNGKDGKDGLTIKGGEGPAGVNGKDGETTTRIVYQPKDAEGNPTGKPETVATLNDGLKFQGDKGGVIAKKLNETLTIKGGADDDAEVADKNLRVDNIDGVLTVRMAKALTDLSSIGLTGSGSNTVINGGGITITPIAQDKKPVSLTDSGLNNGGNTITNVAAGTNGTDAVNLDQLEASSAAAKTEVQAGKNVTINSTQGAKNQTIYTVNADKSVVSAGSDSVVVKAETDAANYTTTYQVDLSNEIKQQIAKEETVVGGKNITVTEGKNDTGGKEFTVNLDKDIDLGEDGSLQIGDTKVDNDGVTVGNTTLNGNGLTIKDGPSVTQSGIDAGNKQITNVTAAVNGTDAVNLSQLNSTVASAGFNLTTNGDTSEIDAMSAEDKSKATRVNTDETFALNQNATHNNIIVKQIDNGYELAANNNFVVGEKGSDSAAGNKGGADGSITVNGKEGATIVINGADGSIVVSGKDGANIVINGADGSISVKGKDGADATITVSNGKGTLDAPAQGGDGITRITYNTNNADGSTTTRQVATMDDGLSFKGDSGESINRKLGSTLNIVGGQTDSSKLSDNNIGVVSSGDKLTVKLSKALTGLTSVQTSDAEGNTVVQNGSGITITPAGNPARTVSLTTKGLNNGGNRITNVAPGVEPTDAVNVSQLNGITQGFNNRIAQAEARADAGTATAMATAGIPQAYIPGKSLVGVGGSTYRGQQAYAVGISSISDGGNWIIKGSVSSNSRGSVGATVGAGYMW